MNRHCPGLSFPDSDSQGAVTILAAALRKIDSDCSRCVPQPRQGFAMTAPGADHRSFVDLRSHPSPEGDRISSEQGSASSCSRLGGRCILAVIERRGAMTGDSTFSFGNRHAKGTHLGTQNGPTEVQGYTARTGLASGCTCFSRSVLITLLSPGETEAGSAGTQPAEG